MFKKLFTITFILVFFLIPSSVLANDLEITCFSGEQSPEIVKNTDPLFQISGFLPGESASRTIFVKNDSNDHNCKISFDVGGTTNLLTDKINVYIPTLFDKTLSEYINSNLLMADLGPNEEVTRTITMSLPSDAGSTYSKQEASFNITIQSEWRLIQNTQNLGSGSVLGATDEEKEDVGEVLGISTLPQTGQPIFLIFLLSVVSFLSLLFLKKERTFSN